MFTEYFEIVKVIKEEQLSRVVKVQLIRNYYDGPKEVIVGFFFLLSG